MEQKTQTKTGFFKNHQEFRFFLLFIFLFFTLQLCHFILRPHISPLLVHKFTASVSAEVINIITPDENVSSRKEYLVSGPFQLKIARGCEGIEGIIILLSAIIAFPAALKPKIIGIIAGAFLLYCFNIIRIAGLYYTVKYHSDLFDIMHMYIGQTFIIIVAVIYFIAWLKAQSLFDEKSI